MSDWSSHAAKRIKQKRNEEQLKSSRALQEETLLESNSHGVWDELRNLLVQMCTEFNAEEGMRDTLAWNATNPIEPKI